MIAKPPERTPPKPDPRITPTTMKGNYPAQYKTFTQTLFKCSACGATMWTHGGAMACLSYECQPKTKQPTRPSGPPSPGRNPGTDSAFRKRHDDDSLWGEINRLQESRQRRIYNGDLSKYSGCKICGSSGRGMNFGDFRHKVCNSCQGLYFAAIGDDSLSVRYSREGITITQYEDILDRIKALLLRFIDWLKVGGYGEPEPGSPYYDDKRKGMSRAQQFSKFRFHGDVFTLLAYDPVKDRHSATCSSDSQKYYFSSEFFDADLDWINDGEHMAALAELFDEVDERQRPPRTEAPGYTICKR